MALFFFVTQTKDAARFSWRRTHCVLDRFSVRAIKREVCTNKIMINRNNNMCYYVIYCYQYLFIKYLFVHHIYVKTRNNI